MLQRIPRKLKQILLVDANARFTAADECGDVGVAHASNFAAELFQEMIHELEMGASTLFDNVGQPIVTWLSPAGNPACLDYVAVSLEIAQGLCTLGQITGFQDCFDFDHQPLLVQLTWASPVASMAKRPRLDRAAMTSDEGKAKLAEIFSHAPLAQWTATADTFLDALNEYIFHEVYACFSTHKTHPRSPYVSETTWDIVRARRSARRVLHRCLTLQQRYVLQCFFDAWRGCSEHINRNRARCGRLDLCIARQMETIARLNRSFRKPAKQDAAAGVRQIFNEAREQSQSTFCSMMRSMLKVGRRYKPVKQSPVIIDEEGVHVGSAEAMPILAKHFAKAERACLKSAEELCHEDQMFDQRDIACDNIPDIMALACSFARLKRGKAAGITTLPAEVYSRAPLQAAMVHFPLMLRQMLRADAPLEWTGGQVAIVPKPGKSSTSVEGGRSILLLDPAHKAIARAIRPSLLAALDKVAFDAQCGGRRGMPLELPKTHVRLHLERLRANRLSGSVLFLDGRNAYYAAVRNLLHTQGGFDDCDCIWHFVQTLHSEEDVRQHLYKALTQPGVLDKVEASAALRNYIRSTVDRTWFTLDVSSGQFFDTVTGTSPGAPLEDLLYQMISTKFLSHVHEALESLGLSTRTSAGCIAPIPEWADDYAVLLEAQTAELAVRQLRDVVPQIYIGLGAVGIELNLARGKTEALLVLNGVHSRRLRRELLSGCDPRLSLQLPSGIKKTLCLSHSYKHLGGLVSVNGGYKADVLAVSKDANRIFLRLSKVFFRNECLSVLEKVQLFQSLVLSKMQQGAMSWFFATRGESKTFQQAVDKWQRKMIAPLFGCSARGSSSAEVQTALGVLSPQQLLDVAHVRWLAGVAPHCCTYLLARLSERPSWILQIKSALERILQVCKRPGWMELLQLDTADFTRWAGQHKLVLGHLATGFCRTVRKHRLRQQATVIQRFRARTRLFAVEGGFGKIPELASQMKVFCNICGDAFANKAACASHKSRKHSVTGAFSGCFGSLCMVCCTEFHTTKRLRLHLRKTRVRGAVFLGSDVLHTKHELLESDILS